MCLASSSVYDFAMTTNQEILKAAIEANVPVLLFGNPQAEKVAFTKRLVQMAEEQGIEIKTFVASPSEPVDFIF